jgi:hypothetical protein
VRPPRARHEGAQIVTKNNRGEPQWAQKAQEQNLRLVGAMRVSMKPAEPSVGSLAPLPPPRSQAQATRSRGRLYAQPARVGWGALGGAARRGLRSRFALPPPAPGVAARPAAQPT